jgi:hypothetical protein
MSKQPIFEHEPCGRCSGTGKEPHGTRCVKCSGRGTVLTNRGKVAQEFFTKCMSKPARAVAPGEQYQLRGDSLSEPDRWITVTATRVEPGGEVTLIADKYTYTSPPDHLIRIAHTAEAKRAKIAAALAYQATLDENGKPKTA